MLWLVLVCVGMIGWCAAEEYPSGNGTIQIDWGISLQSIRRRGAIEKSARYRMYEIGNVIYKFNNSGRLSEVTIRYSGKPRDFAKTLIHNTLSYYQTRGIPVRAEYYGKVSRFAGTARMWLESGGRLLVALDEYTIKIDSETTITYFVQIYNPACNSKSEILSGFRPM